MSFDWEPFRQGGGEFVKFEDIGDQVVGTIVAIRKHTFNEDKGPVALIDLERDDGEQVTLSVDKVDLARQIPLLAPQVGDKLAVKYTGDEKTPNGRKKVFAVRHKEGDRKPVQSSEPVWDEDGEYEETPF